MDTLIAIGLGVFGYFKLQAQQVEEVIRSRQEIRDRSGVNLMTREAAARWGAGPRPQGPTAFHATYEYRNLVNPDAYGGKPRKLDYNKVRRTNNLRRDMDRDIELEAPHPDRAGDGAGYSRFYSPITKRHLAMRTTQFRSTGVSGAAAQRRQFLENRNGSYRLSNV